MREITKKPVLKHLLVYGMWQKPDMVAWHVNNIRRRTDPKKVDTLFIFDTEDPVGIANFKRLCGGDDRKWIYKVSTEQIYEVGIHCYALKYAKRCGYDSVIILQDDQGLLHQDIVTDIERVYGLYKDRVGVIGGRDGYFRGLNNIHASYWSRTIGVSHWIAPGVYAEVDLLNTGPFIYHRDVFERVGFPSLEYGHFNAWEEYSLRCKEAGLQNIILGTNILHEGFGSIKASTIYSDNDQLIEWNNLMAERWREYDENVRKEYRGD